VTLSSIARRWRWRYDHKASIREEAYERSQGDGLAWKAAVKSTKTRRQLALRAAVAQATSVPLFVLEHDDRYDEREETKDGDATRTDGGAAGSTERLGGRPERLGDE
jgi:hypothetical protein